MKRHAFSLLEVILAVALFAIFATGAITTTLRGLTLNRLGSEYSIASQFASEGIEAARSIKNQSFANLVNTSGTGISQSGGVWTFSGTNNTLDTYTRTISIADVYRDVSGNVVESGGTLDAQSKKVTSTVQWSFGIGKNNSISTSSYFTNWKAPFGKGGLLVYGNGGTTSDAILYKTMDASGSWGSASSVADVDGATTNKYARAIRVYSSPSRNEKILISRHYNGSAQWIYAQVFNGTSWGNVQQLSTWTATTFLDVQNFDGAYLANGDFMAIFSDNTTTPKFRTWNGTTWSGQVSMNALSGIPYHIVAKARSTSNEVMYISLDSTSDTTYEYFNGGTYAATSWTSAVDLSTTTVTNTKRMLDFEWSQNSPLSGAAIFAASTADKTMRGRVWVANGSGGGAWGTAVAAAAQTNNMGSMDLTSRQGANQFVACNKDAGTTRTIVCRRMSFSGNVVTWATPTNPIAASATDTGIQSSFDINFENDTSGRALITYGDNTNIPKYKLFDSTTNTITSTATNLSTTPYTLSSPVRTVREVSDPMGSTIMTFFTDSALDLYSSMWSGSYSTPITQHGINGSAITDFWYDFAWDQF